MNWELSISKHILSSKILVNQNFFAPTQCHLRFVKQLNWSWKPASAEKVTHSEWAAPIVAVQKPNGRFCICGDYKVTINPALAINQYPLPRPEELFVSLAGGKKFSKIDLSQAYTQILLDENSSWYVTINTHKGYINTKDYLME